MSMAVSLMLFGSNFSTSRNTLFCLKATLRPKNLQAQRKLETNVTNEIVNFNYCS
jgi:hypothetical protein